METLTGSLKDGFRFPKREKLKRRGEIQAVFNRRHGISCRGAKLIIMENGLGYNRIAFTFTRKFGSAVERNRSRRISREAYRHLRQYIKPGWDLVLLIYPDKPGEITMPHGFSSRTAQLRELLSRARLLENPVIAAGQNMV